MKLEKIVGAGGIPCVLINDRYQIYLDTGVVYDTIEAQDIPTEIFEIRDELMGIKAE